MIVFDLKCRSAGHVFEAWFASSAAFEDQREHGLLICPICGDREIGKALMTPHLPTKGNQTSQSLSVASGVDRDVKRALSELAKAQATILEKSSWVGRDFDRQARAMEAGETDKTVIHGEVTPDEARALIDDGIGVAPLPFPVVPPEKRN